MLNFPENGKYKIVFVKDKTGIIKSDHKDKKLLISKDIKLNTTDDGKLCATFPDFRPQKSPSVFEKVGESFGIPRKTSDTDCSVIISDPSCFNSCVQKDGTYQLSGSKVTFNGTDNDDKLILSGCENSEINMGKGDDNILYREKSVFNNNINLGDGNNTLAAAYKTDADRALVNNNISSGNGQDHIYLRNALGNTVCTGDGNDSVAIEGAPQTKFSNCFQNNSINTGNGNDKVNILGKFDNFKNNSFYLGKGSDDFNAAINPNDDAKTESDYNNNLAGYIDSVSNNNIYATDEEKGWLEKNTFESETHSGNQLSEYNNSNAVSKGFQSIKTKPVPINPVTVPEKNETAKTKSSAEVKRDNAKTRYYAGSLGYNLFGDPKMQEAAFKALDDYVNSMIED